MLALKHPTVSTGKKQVTFGGSKTVLITCLLFDIACSSPSLNVTACTYQMWQRVSVSQQVPIPFACGLTTQGLKKGLTNFRKGGKLFPFPVQKGSDLGLYHFLSSSSLHVQSICHIRFGSWASQSALVVVGRLGTWLCLREGASSGDSTQSNIHQYLSCHRNSEIPCRLCGSHSHFHKTRKPCTQVCLRRWLLIARGGCNPFCSDEEALFRTTPKPEPDQKS